LIVFGITIADEVAYRHWAARGIARVAEPDSVVIERRGCRSLQAPYNSILADASTLPDLEAVVLLREDVVIEDDRFVDTIRAGLTDPRVGVLGPMGGRGARTIAWWQGTICGGIEAPHMFDRSVFAHARQGWQLVDAVDGALLVISPWAAREVRFDERFARNFHGYDVDYCYEVRSRGGTCLVAPMSVSHHTWWKPEQNERWTDGSIAWQRKWGESDLLRRPPSLVCV
jgi:GT2 family glycosyltransferase